MRKIALAVLLLMLCAAPAFARHKKPHKDPRVVNHPKALHQQNPHLKHPVKHQMPKHPSH
jgi:hypothetical protein